MWYSCNMIEALDFARSNLTTIVDDPPGYVEEKRPPWTDHQEISIIWFADGTAVACMSAWNKDHDYDDDNGPKEPLWWIYK